MREVAGESQRAALGASETLSGAQEVRLSPKRWPRAGSRDRGVHSETPFSLVHRRVHGYDLLLNQTMTEDKEPALWPLHSAAGGA